MRIKKLPILKYELTGYNDSGEELFDFVDNGVFIYGKVTFTSSDETYSPTRNSSETVMKIYCSQLYDFISNNDRLVYRGKTYTIESPPELWENDRGYRNVTVITAKNVEG